MWKWRPVESLEIQPQDFHPSPRPWKSLRDSQIPTRASISLIICRGTQNETSEKCYPCSRIEVLPMFPAGHMGTSAISRWLEWKKEQMGYLAGFAAELLILAGIC